MKVKALGFRLTPIGQATLPNLAQRLVRRSGQEFSFGTHERRLYCSVTESNGENFAVGIFLTIRDHKKFLQLSERNGTISITVTELDNDTRPFDFNFFAIHLPSGSGLYSHYFFSCSFQSFFKFLRDQYLRANKAMEEGIEVDDRSAIRASERRNMAYAMFHRRDSFEDAIKNLLEVKQFEYDILTPSSMTQEMQPLSTKLKTERRQIRFKANLSGTSLWNRIKNMLPGTGDGRQRFRVIGKDTSGERVPIDFIAPPDHFSEDDFDDLADNEILNLSNVGNSGYVQKLLHLFEQRKALFTAEADS